MHRLPKATAMSFDRSIANFHRRLGVLASVGLMIAAVTALVLNHRTLFLKPTPAGEGPYGQYLLSHSRSPHDPKRVLVGTSSGAFLSHDDGATFTPINLPIPAQQVVGAQFDPTRPNKIYLVLRERGLFVSADLGQTWQKIELPTDATLQSLHVGLSGQLSVLTPKGLARTDENNEWQFQPRKDVAQTNDPGKALLRTAFNLHDGNFWGWGAVVVTDFVAISLLSITFSGLWMARPRKQSR